MRVDNDPEVQAWYLTLSDTAVAGTVHVSDEVAVDVDEAGDVVGVEFLVAPATIDPSVRETLSRTSQRCSTPLRTSIRPWARAAEQCEPSARAGP